MEIEHILSKIGENKELRESFVDWCKSVEKKLSHKGSVRDDFTSHLVDVIYANIQMEKKNIQNGLTFEFIPNVRSKIPREFIMSEPIIPDHVWEPQTTKLLEYLSTKAKNVIIGGAYFGDQAIIVANHIKSNNGIVHAFDLNTRQSEILTKNALNNKLKDNLSVVNKGLWSDSKTYLDLSDGDDVGFATLAESVPGRAANTISIDDYVLKNGISVVDLIMLDIEGSELSVLQGATNELKKDVGQAPNIIFEIHRAYVDWSEGLLETNILKFLGSFGYKVYSIRDFQANYNLRNKPIELIDPVETYLEGPPHGFNMVAIKDISLIQNKLFRICKNVSPKYIVHKEPKLHHPIDGLM